jgi:lipopolysaccharide export system permease protein
MRLIERYIFARLIRVWVLALVTLSIIIWMNQALRQVDLMTSQGQTFFIFLRLALYILPQIATFLAPAALLIAVIYTFNALNNDSELVVINASGAPQSVLLRPVLLLALIAAIVIGAMTVFVAPLAQSLFRAEITHVRADVVTSILREGQFVTIADGLVFHLRDRRPDGTLQGLFVSDTRDPNSTVTYIAETGSVVESALGSFLIMGDGSIQRRNVRDGSISMIEFTSYAFDLSTFASRADNPAYRPSERTTSYLLHPDPEDTYYQRSPGLFTAELHSRLTAPLYAFVFTLVPLVLLVQAESTRRRRTLTITAGVVAALLIWTAGSFLSNAATGPVLITVLAYALPIGTAVAASILILVGARPRVPERLTELMEGFAERIGSYFSRTARVGKVGS